MSGAHPPRRWPPGRPLHIPADVDAIAPSAGSQNGVWKRFVEPC